MSYIIPHDYLAQIQPTQRAQLTSDATTLAQAENRAIAEVKSHLVQKYIVDSEFTNTAQWSNTVAYTATNRIYLDATAYSLSSTYAIGALVLQAGNVYRCSTAIITPEAFNIAKWTLIGAQYTIFYGSYPKSLFNLYNYYTQGDEVFYNGKTYTCKISSMPLTHETELQFITYENIPAYNVFPDDPVEGAKYWTDNGAYTIPAGTLPTNTTYWTQGDNRNQQILGYTIDIVLYYLHVRIAPMNIPQLRLDNYDIAKQMLKDFAKGVVTLDMQKIQPKQGNSIRWGGNVKNINSY